MNLYNSSCRGVELAAKDKVERWWRWRRWWGQASNKHERYLFESKAHEFRPCNEKTKRSQLQLRLQWKRWWRWHCCLNLLGTSQSNSICRLVRFWPYLPTDFVLTERLWIFWFPRLNLFGCRRNLKITITIRIFLLLIYYV